MAISEKPNVFIVNGYGCHLDTPLGNVYLPRVVRCIKEEKPDLVIFCGGFTQRKTAENKSEAAVMQEFVSSQLTPEEMPPQGLEIEESSYTTLENSREAGRIIYVVYDVRKVRVKHFCEATRAANVVMLDRHFLAKRYELVESIDDITVETASWERADPFKQVGNLVYNKLATTFPRLGLAQREHRRRLVRSTQI